MKAFVINVIGDVGLVLAAFLIFRELGVFSYVEVFESASEHFTPNDGTIVAICLLLLVGAFAKSPSCRSTPGFRTRWRPHAGPL